MSWEFPSYGSPFRGLTLAALIIQRNVYFIQTFQNLVTAYSFSKFTKINDDLAAFADLYITYDISISKILEENVWVKCYSACGSKSYLKWSPRFMDFWVLLKKYVK